MKQAETAAVVYREDIVPTLLDRQAFVRDGLARYLATQPTEPTALELLAFLQARHPERRLDVNSVRPRLTEMEDKGWVAHGAKRRCAVSGKRVYTWRLSAPTRPGRLF